MHQHVLNHTWLSWCVLQLVFTEVGLGAVVLTVNTILLGGSIVFFQSLCLLGYCLFPICIAAIVCLFVRIMVRRGTEVLIACLVLPICP